VKDINTELMQHVVAGWKGTCSNNTIRNPITTFRLISDKAKAWSYAAHMPHGALDLPTYVREEQLSFIPDTGQPDHRRIKDALQRRFL